MRILIAFSSMAFVGTVAGVLALVQVLARSWPILVVAFGVVVTVRLCGRRRRVTSAPLPAASLSAAAAASRQPIPSRPSGCVVVPVWTDIPGHSHHHPVIDGDVIPGGSMRD